MAIQTKRLEDLGGKEVWQIILRNEQGTEAHFLNLGATWQAFLVKQEDGSLKNLVLGFDEPVAYTTTGFCAGQTVGRVAGRIEQGRAKIFGKDHQLPVNQNGHCLHGGAKGFHNQFWAFSTFESDDKSGVVFTYRAKEEEDGFPADMSVEATYTLDNANRLSVTYRAFDVTGDTLFNPTNHVYFNLGDSQDLSTHLFKVGADHVLEVDEDLIPSGNLIDVTGTAYDFRKGQHLLSAIEKTGGIDDTFMVTPSQDKPIAILSEERSGDQISIYSDRNGLVVYTLNFPEDGARFAKDGGKENKRHQGVALEAQFPPNAVNCPHLADTILPQGEERAYSITYHYHSRKD